MSSAPPTFRSVLQQVAEDCRRDDGGGNPLLADARPVVRRPRWLVLIGQVVGVAAVFVVLLAAVTFPLNLLLPEEPPAVFDDLAGRTVLAGINLLVFNGLLIAAVLLWVRWAERRPIATLGLRRGRLLRRFVAGVGFGLLSMAVVVGASLALGQAELGDPEGVASGASALPWLAVLFVPWMVQASGEELLFQGWLLPKVARTYGLAVGVGVTAVVFMVAHLGSPGIEVLGIVNLVLYGVFAAVYALYQGSIAGIAGFHTAWNLAQAHVFGLAVSGGEVGEATAPVSLVTVELTGASWLVGSSFGPEAGLLTTLTIVVGLGVLLVLLRRRAAAAVPVE